MKKLLAAILITVSASNVFAGETKIFTSNVGWDSQYFSKGSFDINADLGRAWVVLQFDDRDPESLSSEYRVKVPGMKFDQTTREVVIEDETGRTVCAYEKKVLFGKILKETKNCSFVEKFQTVEYDDGFEIKKIKKSIISVKF